MEIKMPAYTIKEINGFTVRYLDTFDGNFAIHLKKLPMPMGELKKHISKVINLAPNSITIYDLSDSESDYPFIILLETKIDDYLKDTLISKILSA